MNGDLGRATLGDPRSSRNPLTQRFRDPTIERGFQVEAGSRFRPQVVTTILLAMVAWAATGLLLLVAYPVDREATVATIAAAEVVNVAILIGLARARSWDGIQTLSALVNLAAGLAIIAIGIVIVHMPHVVAPALIVNLLFAFGLSRFGPLGVAAAAPYVAAFAFIGFTGAVPGIGSFEVFLVAVAFVVSLLGGYLLESTTRNGYEQGRIIEAQAAAIAAEKEKSERLLENMMPGHVVAQLREGVSVAERLPNVSVLFADLVGFTPLSSDLTPDRVVAVLDELFSRFDELAGRHGMEKMKTIGDAYMAVAGVTAPGPDDARRAVALGLDMLDAVADFRSRVSLPLELRVGINSGPVVAGVIGRVRYSYDLWGDTVNVASRMESHGVPGAIHITASTAALLGDAYRQEPTGTLEIKGKGPMQTFLIRPAGQPGRSRRRPAAIAKAAAVIRPARVVNTPRQYRKGLVKGLSRG